MKISERESLVLTAYTGKMFCSNFSEFHAFTEEVLGIPIYSHMFADVNLWKSIKNAVEEEARTIFREIEYVD